MRNNLHELVFESHLEQTISFVKDKYFDVFKREAFGVLNMVNQSSSCGNDHIWAFVRNLSFLVFEA